MATLIESPGRWGPCIVHGERSPAPFLVPVFESSLLPEQKMLFLVGLDRYPRGLCGSSPRSVLIKICPNKKIGESEKGILGFVSLINPLTSGKKNIS